MPHFHIATIDVVGGKKKSNRHSQSAQLRKNISHSFAAITYFFRCELPTSRFFMPLNVMSPPIARMPREREPPDILSATKISFSRKLDRSEKNKDGSSKTLLAEWR